MYPDAGYIFGYIFGKTKSASPANDAGSESASCFTITFVFVHTRITAAPIIRVALAYAFEPLFETALSCRREAGCGRKVCVCYSAWMRACWSVRVGGCSFCSLLKEWPSIARDADSFNGVTVYLTPQLNLDFGGGGEGGGLVHEDESLRVVRDFKGEPTLLRAS